MNTKFTSRFIGVMIFLLSCSITLFYGCKKDDTEPNNGVATWGYLQFYQSTDLGYGSLEVYIDGVYEGKFSSVDADGANSSDCSITGFSKKLEKGSYDYQVENAAGTVIWKGTAEVPSAGMCKTIRLLAGGNNGGGGGGGNGGGGGGGTNKAQAIFFTYAATPPITVTVSGLTSTITSKIASGTIPACGAAGCATFDLGIGTHSWTATDGSATWSGTVAVTLNGCKATGLNAAGGGGGGGNGTGELIVYENVDHGNGTTTVTCNGQTRYITSIHPNAGVSNPPPCGASGAANFTLNPGTYAVHASDPSGATWDFNMTVMANGCSSLLLP